MEITTNTDLEVLTDRLEKFDSCHGNTVEHLFSLLNDHFEKLAHLLHNDPRIYKEVSKTWTLLNLLRDHVPDQLFNDIEELTLGTQFIIRKVS